MTPPIRDQNVQRLRRTVPIIDFIARFQELHPRIDGLWEGTCPFHPDHGHALHINVAQGFFHCRTCTASGDAIAYLMKRSGSSFAEAVRTLQRLYPRV